MSESKSKELAVVETGGQLVDLETEKAQLNQRKELALHKLQVVRDLMKEALVKGQDYGMIPGAKKPSLWQPGMQKLLNIFGYTAEFQIVDKSENDDIEWEYEGYDYSSKSMVAKQAKGKYQYTVRCDIMSGAGQVVAQSFGDARSTERGLEPSPPNAILKRAQKRAMGSAITNATMASEIFTVDMEDESHNGGAAKRQSAQKPPPNTKKQAAQPRPHGNGGNEYTWPLGKTPEEAANLRAQGQKAQGYKGLPISKLPAQYLHWVKDNVPLHDHTLQAVDAELARRENPQDAPQHSDSASPETPESATEQAPEQYELPNNPEAFCRHWMDQMDCVEDKKLDVEKILRGVWSIMHNHIGGYQDEESMAGLMIDQLGIDKLVKLPTVEKLALQAFHGHLQSLWRDHQAVK